MRSSRGRSSSIRHAAASRPASALCAVWLTPSPSSRRIIRRMKSHVETVRLSILTFAERGLDIDALNPLWSVDAEWDLSAYEDWSGGVARGPGEILATVGQWLAQFATYDLTIDGLEDHGDR